MSKNISKLNNFLSGRRFALILAVASASMINSNSPVNELESLGYDPYQRHNKWRHRPYNYVSRAERKRRDEHKKQVTNIKMSRKKW